MKKLGRRDIGKKFHFNWKCCHANIAKRVMKECVTLVSDARDEHNASRKHFTRTLMPKV